MRDWPPCPPIQRDGGRRSRLGVNPFISVLTVARCPAAFGSVATTSGHFVHKSERRTRDGSVHIRPVCCRKQTCACGSTPHKHSTVFLPLQMPLPSRRQRHFHGNADRAYNTLHFASQSRVPNGGVAPFGNPPQEKAVRYPSTGRIPPFLVIQPSGCIG